MTGTPMDPDWKYEDEEGDFDDRAPTLDECIGLWRRAIEGHKHSTVVGIRKFADSTCGPGPTCQTVRRTWIESIKRLRAEGLFDVDTSYNLINHIVGGSLDSAGYYDDPVLQEILDRMEALCDAHGLSDLAEVGLWSDPPAGWEALRREYNDREDEMRNAILRAAGEHDMIALLTNDPDEFKRRTAAVETRIKRDHDAARAR
jgi:hypothetical protein